jgi:hypothetical protein
MTVAKTWGLTQGIGLVAPFAFAESIDVSAADWVNASELNPRGISCGVAGDIKIDTIEGDTITFYAAAGIVYPILFDKVYQTGTAATGIVGWN